MQTATSPKYRPDSLQKKVELIISMNTLKAKRIHTGYLPANSQLADFEENLFFIAAEVVNFCNHDEQSPFKRKNEIMTITILENLLLNGEVKGLKPSHHWYINKKEIENLFSLNR